jgi:hypothetical protein
MMVYVLLRESDDGDDFIGVYASEELAEAVIFKKPLREQKDYLIIVSDVVGLPEYEVKRCF